MALLTQNAERLASPVLRGAISSTISNILDLPSPTLTLKSLKRILNACSYDCFIDDIPALNYLYNSLINRLYIHPEVETLKSLLVLEKFHRKSNYLDGYEIKQAFVPCSSCIRHHTTTYIFDDLYSGVFTISKIWDCSPNNEVFITYKTSHPYHIIQQILEGKCTYDLEGRRLTLSGDIETNPGPTTEDTRIKTLERELKELRDRLKRMDNKEWRQIDRKKTEKKRQRYGQGLNSFLSNTGEAMNVLANSAGPVLESIREAMNSITQTGAEVKQAFKVPEGIDLVGSLLSLVMLIKSVLDKDLFMCSLICTQLARLCGVSFASIMALVPRISEEKITFNDEETKSEIRVGEGLFESLKEYQDRAPLAAMATTLVGVVTLFCRGVCPPISEMAKNFAIIGRAAQGVRAVKDFFSWMWDYIMQIYCKYRYGMSREEYDLVQQYPELEALYGGIKVSEKIDKAMIDASYDVAMQIVNIKVKLEDYLMKAAKTGARHHITLVEKMRQRIKEKYDIAVKSPALVNAIRDEPVCVYLYGEPGVGKSVLTQVLIADYYMKHLKSKGVNYNSVSHSRKSINKHWEGYCNQPIVVMDDFGNVKDNMTNPNEEFKELQWMINTSEYPLLMADLSSKGTTFFNSQLVLLSANARVPEIVHMTDPSSILRRMHIWAEVSCKAEYGLPNGKDKNGKVYYQYDKATAAKHKKVAIEELDPLMTEQYEIKIYTVCVDKQAGRIEYQEEANSLTYQEFYDRFEKVKLERGVVNKQLTTSIRKRAGLDDAVDPRLESEVLNEFKKFFDVENFIDAAVKTKQNDTGEEMIDAKEKVEDVDDDLIDITVENPIVQKIRTQLTEIWQKAKVTFNNTYKAIYSGIANGLKSTWSTMSGVVGSFLHYLGTTISNCAISILLPCVTLGPQQVAVATLCGIAAGYIAHKFFNDLPSSCKFSLTLNEIYTPCERCDICKIMRYPSEGSKLDHFLYRIGVPQVKEAVMRCQIWTDDYLCRILNKYSERIRYAERVYDSQPACPKPTVYAQALIGTCNMRKVAAHANSVGMNYTEAMRLIGSLCWYNCKFCATQRGKTYDPMDNDDAIRLGREILEAHNLLYRPEIFLRMELQQGAVKYAEGDLVRVEQSTRVLEHNAVWIQAVTNDGTSTKSTGVFLVGRTLLTTAHTVLSSDTIKFERYLIQNPNSKESFDIPVKDCKTSRVRQLDGKTVDLALITFPKVIPNRPKILSKFLNAKDIDLLIEGKLVLSGFKVNGERLMMTEQVTSTFEISTKPSTYYEHLPGQCPKSEICECELYIGNHIDYDIDTQPGLCGSLISASNKNIPSKLMGMHVAGGRNVPALGVLLTQELLEKALTDHTQQHDMPKSYIIDGRLPYSES